MVKEGGWDTGAIQVEAFMTTCGVGIALLKLVRRKLPVPVPGTWK